MIYETQKIFKNVRPWTIMHQNRIIYERQKILRKNLRPSTVMHQNKIIYETQKILREVFIHVQ